MSLCNCQSPLLFQIVLSSLRIFLAAVFCSWRRGLGDWIWNSGGGGLVGTIADYHRFATMLLNGGELDGARILSPKTLRLMRTNHLPNNADLTEMSSSLFSEANNAGTGFGLGFAMVIDPAKTLIPSSLGEFYWGGAYSTAFFVDPVERITMVFMTQVYPSSTYPIRRQLKTLIYSALTETYA